MTSDVYLAAFAYELGLPRRLDEVADVYGQETIDALKGDGLSLYRQAVRSPLGMAISAARATLDRPGVEKPELVIFCSRAWPVMADYEAAVASFLQALDLSETPFLVLAFHGCGNIGLAMPIAVDAIHAGRARSVLLVTTDAQPEGERLLSGMFVSDGAASCVTTATQLDDGFRVIDVASRARTYGHSGISRLPSRRLLLDAVASVRQADRDLRARGRQREGSRLITANYGLKVSTLYADLLGVRREDLITDCLASIAHCFSADILIALSLLARGALPTGAPVTALMSGFRSVTLAALEWAPFVHPREQPSDDVLHRQSTAVSDRSASERIAP